MKRQSFAALSKQNILSILRSSLFENTVILYFAHFAKYIFPLVTLPYLARVLGAKTWGVLAFAQAFAIYLTMAIEYGFDLSATREVARNRDSKEKLSELLGSILGAKLLLVVGCLAVSVIAQPLVPLYREYPLLFWACVFSAVTQAPNLLWFFQGMERMRTVATLDVLTKTLSIIGIFAFVHRPEDAYRVPILYGISFITIGCISLHLAYQDLPLRRPTLSTVIESLKLGWSLFLFRTSASLINMANVFILGILASPEIVGYYAGAEKIITAVRQMISPIIQAMYPRMAHMVSLSPKEGALFLRKAIAVIGSIGLALGIITYFGAPTLVHLGLGAGYEPATPALRILSLVAPSTALGIALGVQWAIPLGLESSVVVILFVGGTLNAGLAFLLVPALQHIGMAYSVATSNIFVTAATFILLHFKGANPFAKVHSLDRLSIGKNTN